MRSEGASEAIIAEVETRREVRGRRISFDGATQNYDGVTRWLEGVLENCEQFPFRLHLHEPDRVLGGLLPVKIFTENGIYWIDTSRLSTEEKGFS